MAPIEPYGLSRGTGGSALSCGRRLTWTALGFPRIAGCTRTSEKSAHGRDGRVDAEVEAAHLIIKYERLRLSVLGVSSTVRLCRRRVRERRHGRQAVALCARSAGPCGHVAALAALRRARILAVEERVGLARLRVPRRLVEEDGRSEG